MSCHRLKFLPTLSFLTFSISLPQRCGALKFVAAVVMKISHSSALLPRIARLVGRERRQCGRHTNEALKTLIEDVFALVSKTFGADLTAALAAEERAKRELRAKKEQEGAELAVTDAAKFAERKRKKNRARVDSGAKRAKVA